MFLFGEGEVMLRDIPKETNRNLYVVGIRQSVATME